MEAMKNVRSEHVLTWNYILKGINYLVFGIYYKNSFGSRGTQLEILRKTPKNNNKAWIKFSETILSILGDCWKKIICSSLPARLMEEFPASNLTTSNLTYREVSYPYK